MQLIALNAMAGRCAVRQRHWRGYITTGPAPCQIIARVTMRTLIERGLAAQTIEPRRCGDTMIAKLTAKGRAAVLADKRRLQCRLAAHPDELPPARLWYPRQPGWDAANPREA